MLRVLKIFWDICRLKAVPQDIPYGQNLLIGAFIAAVLLDSFTTPILMPNLSGFEAIQVVAIYNVIYLIAVYLLLAAVGYTSRAIQTLTALLASDLFISLVLLPGLLLMNAASQEMKSFAFYYMAYAIWRLTVNTHIFRHAFSVNQLLAMILSVSYFIFGMFVAEIVIPVQTP